MGYAGDSKTGADTINAVTTPSFDFVGFNNFDTASGLYVPSNHAWSAKVIWDLGQSYNFEGPTSNFSALTGQMHQNTTSIESGATSDIGASSSMSLSFQVTQPTLFRLSGNIAGVGPNNRNNANLNFYSVSGGVDTLFYIAFLREGFDRTFTLGPGDYKLSGFVNSAATGNEAASASLSYRLEAVPEPTTSAFVALGGLAMVKRRRSTKN